ncbi:hypothetical protein B4U79_03950 [Dinothrombium tinctorium]|uniref:Uncharacterized protein n=1 Tax=Dinothrombium tinctorium TaxID=1965070 RepID=A0A3S3P9I0_9ACAR|nr:hypothetical protein B4U79_03348 [Dinothrombium tinctorium]RWS08140.1 hypothetical protein B4U79_03950 [Dinothrombium tinctorium]
MPVLTHLIVHRLPTHHYVYHPAAPSPYLPGAPGLILPNPAAPLTPTHFFDYPPAAYPPPPHPYTNGFESAATYAPFHPQHHPGATIATATVAGAVAAAVSTTSSASAAGAPAVATVNQSHLFNV